MRHLRCVATRMCALKRSAVDLPFRDYFTGKSEPFAFPGLSYQLDDVGCRGHNLYLPIPYAKSCKIVAEKDWGAYFQFVFTTFPEGTEVPTFSGEYSEESLSALKKFSQFCHPVGEGNAGNSLGTDPLAPRKGEEGVIPSGPLSLGQHALRAGDHTLTVEIVGANKEAVKAYMFGIDEILLKTP